MNGDKDIFALLIVGSRGINDYDFFKRKMDKISQELQDKYTIMIVSGGANGVDTMAERYADENNFDIKIFRAQWNLYGKKAGYIRNEEMHKYIAGFEHRKCIAFWDGKSRGTAHSFRLANKYGNELERVGYDI